MKHTRLFAIAALVAITILTQGCIAEILNSFKCSYETVTANFNIIGSGKLAVTTHDARVDIVAGRYSERLAALKHAPIGTIEQGTSSGKPLAEDMTGALVASFEKSGFKTTAVIVGTSDSEKVVKNKLLAANVNKSVILLLNEWVNNIANMDQRITLVYDVTLQVLDNSANIIAEKHIKGEDDLGADPWAFTGKESRIKVEKAFKAKLEELVNNPDIQRALSI